jgi:hypothetical protein
MEELWETDSEEEAFVDSLALSLMEDSMDVPVDLDDEDPAMDDWGDLNDDVNELEDSYEAGAGKLLEEEQVGDNDDNIEWQDDDDGDDEIVEFEGQDSSEDDQEEEEDLDDDNGLVIADSDMAMNDADGFDSDASEERPRKKRTVLPVFADATEYEELIMKDWQRLKGDEMQIENKQKGRKRK